MKVGPDLMSFVLAAAASLSACAHHQGSQPPNGSPSGRPPDTVCRTIDVDTAFGEERACPQWRKIAVASDSAAGCPEPAPFQGQSWTVSPVFAASPPGALPECLRPYCLYETSADDAGVLTGLDARLDELVAQGRLERVDSSCAAVSPTAPSRLSTASWQRLRHHFLAHAGRVDLAGVMPPDDPTVRLAFIDTQPGGRAVRGNSEHGYTLERLARELICAGGDGRCAARLATYLGMPIVGFDRGNPGKTEIDRDQGGFYGSADQLAGAVWTALEDWRSAGEDALVLNLSVAWDGARFGGLEARVEDMPVPVQALYNVLAVAACRGAVAVAAAGNRKGGFDEPPGPLLPGGWEVRGAPSPADCERLDSISVAGRRKPPARDPGPLLYAAGGVRAGGSPLANARPGGEPPRVAYGDHAVTASGDAGAPTTILTGSSVATAVISATAAAVWRLRPDLDRAGLMDLLYESGEDLGRRAAFHHAPSGKAPGVRRVALCPAIAGACAAGGCAPPACPESPPPASLATLALDCQTASLAGGTLVDAARIDRDLGDSTLCKAREIRFDARTGPPTDPCPTLQYFGVLARPWSHPQPTTNPCSGCTIDPPPEHPTTVLGDGPGDVLSHTLHIEIDPDWRGGVLREAFLDIGDLSFALDLKPLDAGDCATVEGIAPSLLAPAQGGLDPPVALRFRVEPGDEEASAASVEVPIFVGR